MSTPAFASNPRPEMRIRLVGGPDFFERLIEGAALVIPHSNKHAMIKKAHEVTG
jgi:hypothetical protein